MDLQSWKYIALLGAVIVVFALIFPKKTRQHSHLPHAKGELEQMELSLGHFMENMEQQHDELVNVLSASMNQLKEENKQKSEGIAALEKKCALLEEQIATLSHAYVALETKFQLVGQPSMNSHLATTTQASIPAEQQAHNPNSIHNRYAEIFDLYDAGKSIEFIAKKLGKNNGEVQLIIQLAKQEEKIQNG